MAVTFFPLGLSKEARVTLSQVIYQLGQNKGLIRQADEQATSDPSVVTTVVIILLAISLSMGVLCFTFRAVFLAYHSEAMYMAFEEIEGFDDSEERIIRAKYPSNWTEAEEQSYELSRAFESHHPPGSHNAEITQEQERFIAERGVTAWELEAGEEVNVIVEERTEVSFHGGEYCVQTNLPLPFRETVCYFEVKIFDKPDDTLVALGLTTKPFPSWRMPGKSRHSVGYHSNGRKYCNDPFEGRPFGPVFQKGDVIG
ncbi:Protein ssh4, partial [Basidiobolus ranarum]